MPNLFINTFCNPVSFPIGNINYFVEIPFCFDETSNKIDEDIESSDTLSSLVVDDTSGTDIKGNVICSENTDWTVIFSKESGLAEPCFSRVIFVRPFEKIEDIKKFQNRKIQSIGLEISDKTKRKMVADDITKYGGDRCPHVGMMSLYSSPWDGMFTIDRLVRWIPLDD